MLQEGWARSGVKGRARQEEEEEKKKRRVYIYIYNGHNDIRSLGLERMALKASTLRYSPHEDALLVILQCCRERERGRGAGELVLEDVDEELQGFDKLELEPTDTYSQGRYFGQASQENGVARGSGRGSGGAATLSSSHGVKIRKLLFGSVVRAPESWMQGNRTNQEKC